MNQQLKEALDYIDMNKEAMLEFWKSLVNTESGPDNKAGVDSVISQLAHELQSIGFKNQIIPYEKSGNILISQNHSSNEKSDILIIGHADTVFSKGTLEKNPFRIQEDKAYGPGVLDMKGGLVVAVYALKSLHAAKYQKHSVKVVISGDEETAHTHSGSEKTLIEAMSGCKAAFNVETGFLNNGMVVGRKGGIIFEIQVKGIPAHTGNEPEKGRNAIIELAHKIMEIHQLEGLSPGITYNVGTIKGGIGPNTVPEFASAIIGVRYEKVSQEKEIRDQLDKIASKVYIDGTKSTLFFKGKMNPMEPRGYNYELLERVIAGAQEIGIPAPHPIIVGGASDSACSVMEGVPTVCAFGPKGEGNHTPHEYACVESLFERTKLLVSTIMNMDEFCRNE